MLITLAGNPNVGKSTLFNALTGMKQHTGNWPGKTVALAQGDLTYKGTEYRFVDLPGTYSLTGQSPEEVIAADFLREEATDCTIVVCDATCLERSLILALQVIRYTSRIVVCVNLIDEAQRDGLTIDTALLSQTLGVPVIPTCAESKAGLDALMETVRGVCDGFLPCRPLECEDHSPEALVRHAAALSRQCTLKKEAARPSLTARLDSIVLHPIWGYVILLILLLAVFWLTIEGANYPSQGLQWCFDRFGFALRRGAKALGLSGTITSLLLDGVYATTARVVAVMLPPMVIFFPCFTLLEDFGYLPRVAFLMDEGFRRSGACGKQSLTLCMGFGCNAVGVTGCRIIDSPRERLIAILTNAFVPCNGRFPGLIFFISFLIPGENSIFEAAILTLCIMLCVLLTLAASKFLHRSVLQGTPSTFVMELPPYRHPRIGQVILRSIRDRVLFILGRAVMVAAPSGLLIWLLGNCSIGELSLLQHAARVLDTPAAIIGLSGAALLAFLLATTANELVLPVLLMILTAGSTIGSEGSIAAAQILQQSGWSLSMSVCMILFYLFHWPCATTLLTIRKETGSLKWTLWSALLPTAVGCILCTMTRFIFQLC